MKPNVKKLLDTLAKGKRPDLASVKIWLDLQGLTQEEYEEALSEIEKEYKISPDELDIITEEPGKHLNYTDDFMPLMHDVKGWLKDYVDHTKGSESPTAFHFAVGLTILGASLKRRTFIDQNVYKIYPAVQSMLVGPSGKVKKSTAASYGVNLTFGLKEGYKPLFNLLPDEGTGEALKRELAEYTKRHGEATGLLYVSELGTFLGKQEYNVNLVQTLTDLFDSRLSKRRRTISGGNQEIKNIAVSALFCSNEDWLADAIPASAFGGGFFGRMLVFYQEASDRCFPRPLAISREDQERLLNTLEPVRFINGETTLTRDADLLYDKIYRDYTKNWPEDERLAPFYERIPDHILRIGMLLAVSSNPQNEAPVISEKDIDGAKAIVDWIYKYLPRVYAHLGGSKFGSDHYRIYEIIRRAGGTMEEKELGRKLARRLSSKQLAEHLETMKVNGVLTRVNANPWEGKYAWKLERKMQ